jgi:hypothetical protein
MREASAVRTSARAPAQALHRMPTRFRRCAALKRDASRVTVPGSSSRLQRVHRKGTPALFFFFFLRVRIRRTRPVLSVLYALLTLLTLLAPLHPVLESTSASQPASLTLSHSSSK